MSPSSITRLDLMLAAPEIFLLAAACIILLIDLILDEDTRWESFVLSLLALAGAAWVTARTGVEVRTVGWHGTYVADPVGNLLKVVAYGVGARERRFARRLAQQIELRLTRVAKRSSAGS